MADVAKCPQCGSSITSQQYLLDEHTMNPGEWTPLTGPATTFNQVGVRFDPCGHFINAPLEVGPSMVPPAKADDD